MPGISRVAQEVRRLLPAFKLLLSKPTQLQLIGGESHPVSRKTDDQPDPALVLNVEGVTAMGVLVYQMVQQSQHMTA